MDIKQSTTHDSLAHYRVKKTRNQDDYTEGKFNLHYVRFLISEYIQNEPNFQNYKPLLLTSKRADFINVYEHLSPLLVKMEGFVRAETAMDKDNRLASCLSREYIFGLRGNYDDLLHLLELEVTAPLRMEETEQWGIELVDDSSEYEKALGHQIRRSIVVNSVPCREDSYSESKTQWPVLTFLLYGKPSENGTLRIWLTKHKVLSDENDDLVNPMTQCQGAIDFWEELLMSYVVKR